MAALFVFRVSTVDAAAQCIRAQSVMSSSCPSDGNSASVPTPPSVSILSRQALCQKLGCTRGPQLRCRLLLGLLTVLGIRPLVRIGRVNSLPPPLCLQSSRCHSHCSLYFVSLCSVSTLPFLFSTSFCVCGCAIHHYNMHHASCYTSLQHASCYPSL